MAAAHTSSTFDTIFLWFRFSFSRIHLTEYVAFIHCYWSYSYIPEKIKSFGQCAQAGQRCLYFSRLLFLEWRRASGWGRYLKRHLLNAMIYFSPVQNACYLDNSGVFVASGVELAVAWQCRTSELCHQRCHECCCCCLLFQASIPSPLISKPFLNISFY